MAVYTDVGDEELVAFVAAYDIGAVVAYKGIAEGVENTNYLLQTTTGSHILTLYEKRVHAADLPYFLGFMEHLAAQGDRLLFGIGVGEVPLVQQCTISVWRDAAAIDQYAYRQTGHREVVKLTRQRQWYSEELFARFAVLRWEQ